jgi:hypothetical protein
MDLNNFMKSYAEEINGNFSEYDEHRSVIVVPLGTNRQQAVVGEIDIDHDMIVISSKVCIADDKIQFKELLEENHKSTYGKFTISNDFLKVESKGHANEMSSETLKKVIQEIAKLADKWELNITGRDIF